MLSAGIFLINLPEVRCKQNLFPDVQTGQLPGAFFGTLLLLPGSLLYCRNPRVSEVLEILQFFIQAFIALRGIEEEYR